MSKRVLVCGGLNCAESLWSTHRGFLLDGHEVAYVPTSEIVALIKQPRAGAIDDLLKLMETKPDLVVWWQPQNDANAVILEAMRAASPNTRMVMQSIDDPYVFDSAAAQRVFPCFDYAVTCARCSVPWYEARGVKPIVGYPACDAVLHGKAVPTESERCAFNFVATNTYRRTLYRHVLAGREQMVRGVAACGRVNLYGWEINCKDLNGSVVARGFVPYDAHPGIYAASKVTLSSHVRPDAEGYLNERTISAMASGACVLCDRVAGITEIFQEGEEIVLWSTLDELKEKAAWLVAHDAARQQIGQKARAAVFGVHDNVTLARRIIEAACAS